MYRCLYVPVAPMSALINVHYYDLKISLVLFIFFFFFTADCFAFIIGTALCQGTKQMIHTLLFVRRGSLALSPKFDYKTGTAQLVEPPTEKSGAVLTRVRVPSAARDFSPRVSFQCRLFYGVRTDPVCNRMHQDLCAR